MKFVNKEIYDECAVDGINSKPGDGQFGIHNVEKQSMTMACRIQSKLM